MIQITKAEHRILSNRYPELSFTFTVHKIYMEEKPSAMRFLKRLRETPEDVAIAYRETCLSASQHPVIGRLPMVEYRDTPEASQSDLSL